MKGMLDLLMLLALPGAAVAAPAQIACATAHSVASEACLSVMRQGGNAFDAIAEPTGSGLGGGFRLLHRAQDGFDEFVVGREVAPLALRPR